MTNTQRLTIRASEIRQRLNEISGLEGDELTDEVRAESDTLTVEYRDTETRLRAAVAAEGAPIVTGGAEGLDAETREKLELRGRASLGAYVVAALAGRMVVGAEAEYREACGFHDGIPMDLWETDRPAPETRATTPAPTTGTGVNVAPISPFVFAPSIAPRLGIEVPSVPSGAWSEMTITTSVPAAPKNKGDAADGTAGALTAVTASPRRISARLSLTLEDVAAVGQSGFEAMLRQNASMKLSDAYDGQCISGNGTAPNVNGLINQLTDPTDPGSVSSFDDFVAVFADALDGLWASTPREVAIVANVDAFKLSAKTFRDGTGGQSRAGDVAFSDYAEAHYGAWFTNSRMPATASTIARGIVYRMGRMGMRTAVHPSWGSLGIDDIVSDSASGIRHFSLHTMVGDKVLIVQPDAYDLVEFKVA